MTVDRRQAELDLNAKLVLESNFRPGLGRARADLVREVVRSLASTGSLPGVRNSSQEALEPILASHYAMVSTVFGDSARTKLPSSVVATPEENAEIDAALAEIFARRATDQARIIAETDDDDAVTALGIARLEQRRLVDEGEPMMSERELALATGAIFGRKLDGRASGIVSLETQAAAEGSKLTEIDVLMGLVPFALGGSSSPADVVKEWVTQGDSRVRDHHLDVDSDQVDVTKAFTVNGQKLMYPGDTSLGATADNVVNCRCASIFDVEAVASSRQR